MRFVIRKLFISCLCIFCLTNAAMAAPIDVPSDFEKIEIHSAGDVRYAITSPEATGPPPDSVFKPLKSLNLGVHPDESVWLQFDLRVPREMDSHESYILEVRNRPGVVTLFEQGVAEPLGTSGVLIPINDRALQESAVAFPIQLDPGKTERFSLRMNHRYAQLGYINLYTKEAWAQEKETRNLLFGCYAGLIGALLVVSVGLFRDRKTECVLYMLTQGSIHLGIPANILGYTAWLWPNALRADYNLRPLMIFVGSASLALFSSIFLRLKERAPRANQILLLSGLAVAGSWLWTAWDPGLLSSVTAPLTMWTQVFCLSLGVYFLYHGDKAARFYVIGFGSLLVSTLFTIAFTTYRGFHLQFSIPMPISVVQVSAVINALALAYAILERLTEEREGRLQAEIVSRKSAESLSRLKSDLLRNMSHELLTPLNAIVGFSEVLEENLQDQESHQYAAIIQQNSNRLTTIINEILDYTNLVSGELPLSNAEFQLPDLMNEILNYYQPTTVKKSLVIKYETAPEVPALLHGDRFRIKQILMHVIGNALQFTEKGSLEITVDMNPKNSKLVRIQVKDTGPGMNSELKSHLFEPFSQADTSQTRAHGGLGMGLTFSKALARHMGGNVNLVASDLYFGTTIEILIPVSLREPEPVSSFAESQRPSSHRLFKFRLHGF